LGVGAALDVGSLHKDTEAYIADATVKSASFAASSVDTTNNTVEFGVPHGWTTGQPVIYNNGNGTSVGNLSSGDTVYYVIADSPTRIKLASSLTNAFAGIAIDLTSAGTSTAQSFKAVTVDPRDQLFGPSAVTIGSDSNSIDLGLPHGFTTG